MAALTLVVALGACQSVDDDRASSVAGQTTTTSSSARDDRATEGDAAATERATAYPRLDSVPRRPQLSYTVAQSRRIVEGLVADLENARYTDRVIRYRSGQSALPPPPPPAGYEIAEVAAEQAEALVPEPPEPAPVVAPPLSDREAGAEQIDLRDDTLDEFVTDMVADSRSPAAEGADSTPDLADPTLADAPPAAPSAPEEEPWREPRSIVDWWDRLFGEDQTGGEVTSEAAGAPQTTADGTTTDSAGTVERSLAVVEGPAAGGGSSSTPASYPGAGDATAAAPPVVPPTPAPPLAKPMVVVVQPIPEPSVAIEIAEGLVAIPAQRPAVTSQPKAVVPKVAQPPRPLVMAAAQRAVRLPVAKPAATGIDHQAIAFAEGEATLSPTALTQLQALATAAHGREAWFRVQGGGASRILALDRAQAVAVQLVRLGVSAADVQVEITAPRTDRDHVVLTMAAW